jgi:molybdopterin converting factor subunit 1
MRETVRIRVLLFSVLRERLASRELEVELPDFPTVSDLLDVLSDRYPVIREYGRAIRVAVNETYAGPEERISTSDTVALITPVSGG